MFNHLQQCLVQLTIFKYWLILVILVSDFSCSSTLILKQVLSLGLLKCLVNRFLHLKTLGYHNHSYQYDQISAACEYGSGQINSLNFTLLFILFYFSVSLFKKQTVDWLFLSGFKCDRYFDRHQCRHCLSAQKWCFGFLGLCHCR